jgi:hypothetical protein
MPDQARHDGFVRHTGQREARDPGTIQAIPNGCRIKSGMTVGNGCRIKSGMTVEMDAGSKLPLLLTPLTCIPVGKPGMTVGEGSA